MVERSSAKQPEWRPRKSQVLMPRDDDGFPVPQDSKPDSIFINGREISIADLNATTE